jgi:GntR family transcriptional repressor for pyruvate dehydrogenase complex
MFEILIHKCLSEEIADEFARRIHTGELTVGEKLPSERQLAKALGVSRSSLRDALHDLNRKGLVRFESDGGKYVNPISIQHILPSFSTLMTQNEELIRDTLSFRLYLETQMASMSAKTRTEENLRVIEKTIDDMENEVNEGGFGVDADNRFHLEVAYATQNRAFALIFELMAEVMTESRKATLRMPEQPRKTLDDHRVIFRAITKGDSEAASMAMYDHLTKAFDNLQHFDPDWTEKII